MINISDKSQHLCYNEALFENMAAFADVVWSIDVKEEIVITLCDHITPERVGTKIPLAEICSIVVQNNTTKEAEEILQVLDINHLRSLKKSEEFLSCSYYINGEQVCLRCILTPQFDKDGNVSLVYISFNNIQPQKQKLLADNADRRMELYSSICEILATAENVDQGVNRALAFLGNFLKVSRVYIFENDPNNRELASRTYEWCAEGIIPDSANLQQKDFSELGYTGFFEDKAVSVIPNVSKMLEKARPYASLGGAKAMLHYAIYDNGKFYGIIGLDDCERVRKDWEEDENEHKMLGFVANLLSMYLVKERNLQKALTAESEIKEESEQAKAAHEIIKALTKDYVNVYIFNPIKKIINVEKQEGYFIAGSVDNPDNEFPFEETVNRYIEERVYQPDRSMMRDALSLEKIISSFEHSDEYIGNFRVMTEDDPHYFQFKFIKQSEERVIAAFRNIDQIVNREIEQRKLIEETLASAEKANKAKTIFLKNMSHDIRTPMNAIVGYTALAASSLTDLNTVKDYLKKIKSSSDHLLSLINDVLDMSRIESGKLSMDEQETSLRDLLQEVKGIVASDVKNKKLNLSLDTTEVTEDNVVCDKVKLEQAILNCVTNAVKFTPLQGSIWLKISQIPSENVALGKYLFTIKDSGIGMSPQFIEHIFEPFERERSANMPGIQGTGLGMTICKSIIDMMGGEITVTSKQNVGTEISITLALKLSEKKETEKDSSDHSSEDSSPSQELDGIKILVVEDNDSNREIVEFLLCELGAEVDTAENGAVAVEKVQKGGAGKYDVVLMDIMMPVMDGLQATKQIRKLSNQQLSDIPIIALTANAFDEDKKLVLEVGMNGHVAKPIDIDILAETVKHVLEKEAFKQMAYRDTLTGLFSRHYITTWVTEHKKNPVYPVSYISVDVNNLKYINDNFGHTSGDLLLKTVGDLFLKYFSEHDSKIIRTGGDEYLLLCKNMTNEKAEELIAMTKAEAAQTLIEDTPITFCTGVVTQTEENYDFDKGVREADEIMMEAKHIFHGRK